MLTMPPAPVISSLAQIPTWFGCGGGAARFATPGTLDELRALLAGDPDLKVLGDGANLLVADTGVKELVVALNTGDFAAYSIDPESGIVRAGAGVNLPKLIHECVRAGLGGLETLGGIPASVGGAIVMNAGGQFGQTGDWVHEVDALTRTGEFVTLTRPQMEFTYRATRFGPHADLILTGARFKLRRGDPGALRDKLKEVMAYKKNSQPMGEKSAGCAFKNPILKSDLPGIAVAGTKVSAGMLIDKSGCKGLCVGGAFVSDRHGNFLCAKPGCTASDLLNLMRMVRAQVRERLGVELEPEVRIWGESLENT